VNAILAGWRPGGTSRVETALLSPGLKKAAKEGLGHSNSRRREGLAAMTVHSVSIQTDCTAQQVRRVHILGRAGWLGAKHAQQDCHSGVRCHSGQPTRAPRKMNVHSVNEFSSLSHLSQLSVPITAHSGTQRIPSSWFCTRDVRVVNARMYLQR
jgi:hypothetical protein